MYALPVLWKQIHFYCFFQLQENAEELAHLESLDNGKPLAVAKAADVPQVENYTYSVYFFVQKWLSHHRYLQFLEKS